MKTAGKRKYTPDEIRTALLSAGLTEEEKPIDGRAYTFSVSGDDAIAVFSATAGIPARFSIDHHFFILAQ